MARAREDDNMLEGFGCFMILVLSVTMLALLFKAIWTGGYQSGHKVFIEYCAIHTLKDQDKCEVEALKIFHRDIWVEHQAIKDGLYD